MIKSRLNSRPFNDKHFQDRFRQYTMDCEFSDIDNEEVQEEELNEVFSSLVIDMQTNHDYFPIDNDNENLTTYFSTYGEIDVRNAVSTTSELANKICIHSVTKLENTSNVPSEQTNIFTFATDAVSRYTSSEFLGMMIDTGASKKSTAGYSQFLAYQKMSQAELDVTTGGTVSVQFGIDSTTSIGCVMVDMPIGVVEFHVVNVDTPFLLSLAHIDKLQIFSCYYKHP